MRDPSRLSVARDSECSCFKVACSFPVAASQMRAVLSEELVTMRFPSGLKAADHTEFSCPDRTASCLPVEASQTRAVLSLVVAVVTMRAPSGLKVADQTE